MATYINYGQDDESDAVLQGAEWLRGVIRMQGGGGEDHSEESQAFYSKFQELYLEAQENPKRHDQLMGKIFDLFLEHSKDIFAVIPQYARVEEKTQEVEGFFAIVMSLLLMLDDESHLEKSTLALCDLFGGGETHKELRLRLLMWLYNTFNQPTFPLRFTIFQRIVKFASSQGLFEQIVPYLEYLDNWMADWDLKPKQKEELFLEVSGYMRNIGKKLEAFNYMKRHIMLFQGRSEKELASADIEKNTIQLVKDAIMLPMVMQVDDVLALDAVKTLRKSKHKELVGLLDIFLSGTFDDLRRFEDKNGKIFKEHSDLKIEDVTSKVRLLTLATLAQGKSEVPLSDVAKALQEDDDKVEKWVVKAISEDVIDGRIDQLNNRVLVKSNFQRKFGKDEWQFLDTKLSTWIENLESLIKLVGVQKEREKQLLGNVN